MTETIHGDVLHTIPPDELDSHDLERDLRELAESRYVLVIRRGGQPSLLDLVVAFITRTPIEAVTVVASSRVEEGAEVVLTAEETEMAGVYVTTNE